MTRRQSDRDSLTPRRRSLHAYHRCPVAPSAPPPDVRVEPMARSDWPAVARIFGQGIATDLATFETVIPSWEDWDRDHLPAPRLVARADGEVIGWIALAPFSVREIYRGVAELSVYVDEGHRGRGVGRALLTALIEASEDAGIWTLQAGMLPENKASVGLHRSCGFREVGIHERLGRMGDRWRDVLLLERRSQRIG